MKAINIFKRRIEVADNAFAELVLWRLPESVPPCSHSFKYRLALVHKECCVVRYDNERGKGDHRHFGETETAYDFHDIDRLIADFHNDVTRWLHEHSDH